MTRIIEGFEVLLRAGTDERIGAYATYARMDDGRTYIFDPDINRCGFRPCSRGEYYRMAAEPHVWPHRTTTVGVAYPMPPRDGVDPMPRQP